MRRYETIFITDPDIPDENRDPIYERVKDIIEQQSGFLARIEKWGTKRLSYDIRKKVRGYYVRLDYCGTGGQVNEIERFFRIDDRILKYMTVLLEKNADPDRIKEEIAQIEAQEEEQHQANEEIAGQPDMLSDDSDQPLSDSDASEEGTDDMADEPESESDVNTDKEQ